MVNRGGPDRPLMDAELVAKFAGNVKHALPLRVAETLRNAIQALPEGNILEIAELFRGVTPTHAP